MLQFTDTHCHLNLDSFNEDLGDVIRRAGEQNLYRIMIPGIDLEICRSAIQFSEIFDQCYAAVGIHPNDATLWDESTLPELRKLAAHPKVRAIGEIGLDYYRDRAPADRQRAILRDQLDLAAEVNLPVIIHIREAMRDAYEILFAWQEHLAAEGHPLATLPGVLHSFPGTFEDAKPALDHHFMIGISGPVTFKKAVEKHDLAANLPLDAILLETDAPFMTPKPHRGKRNEPAYIPYIAEKIADLRETTIDEIAAHTALNAQRFFRW
ncbi:MAG: TatD family hydrolase [Anaerolineaceae bacterium]|nr:TatD family hydrolase [Anaerolineaceae bacterium]